MSKNSGAQDDEFLEPIEIFGDTLAVFESSDGKYLLSLPSCLQKRRVLVGGDKECPELLRAVEKCWSPKLLFLFTH